LKLVGVVYPAFFQPRHLHVHLVLHLDEVIGKIGGVIAGIIQIEHLVRQIPFVLELRCNRDGLVIQRPHPRGWAAFENNVARSRIMTIGNHNSAGMSRAVGQRRELGPIAFVFVMEVLRNVVLLAYLPPGHAIGLDVLPFRARFGEEVVRFT
jgi:hypothetical protein